MNKVHKIMPIISLICIICLIIYAAQLNKKINFQDTQISKLKIYESQITELKDRINEYQFKTDAVVMNNTEKINSFHKQFGEESLYVNYKNKIQSLLNKKINDIVSKTPFNQGSWVVSNTNFISPTFIEVIYEDGHDVSSSLIEVVKNKNNKYSFMEIR